MSALDDILAKDAGEIDVLEWAVILMPKEKAEEAAEKLAALYEDRNDWKMLAEKAFARLLVIHGDDYASEIKADLRDLQTRILDARKKLGAKINGDTFDELHGEGTA